MSPTVATILYLEDSALDAELIRDRLEKSGLAVDIELVCGRKEFVAKLQERRFDLILSDYQVPGFDGLTALALTREYQPETPFIFVSGAMGEELAVETLKRGATDYVLKQRLARLPAAVERALAEARVYRERRQAEEHAAASAHDLARLLIKEKRHTALLERVALASRTMNAVLSAESIAHSLTEEARSILGAQRAVTLLTTAEDGAPELQTVSTDGSSGDGHAAAESGFDHQLAAAVRRDLRPIRVSSAAGSHGEPGRSGRLVAPLLGHAGQVVGVIELCSAPGSDFTAEDEAVAMQLAAIAASGLENARLYELLRAQDQRKDEFLATLAHELRNPLAPVRNGLQILKLTRNEGQSHQVREMMERQLGHMVRLIDDLLDLSRITRGRVELRKEWIELRTVVDIALEASRPLIDAAGHALEVKVTGDLYVHADPTRMAQVLANLLNNAAKYTPRGGQIALTANRDGQLAVVQVNDTGVGIPAEMLPRVFDMFTQVGRTLDRSQGGLGIGLTLVRRLVEMHGGTVEVQSPGPGSGTTFTVKLPVTREAASAQSNRSASPN